VIFLIDMSNFTEQQINEVWEKGRTIPGLDRDVYRKDAAGAIIKKTDRRVNSQYGWEIDHVFPKAKLKERGIPEDKWDDLINLRPFHADNNRKKSDDYPDYTREKVMNKETHKNITLEKAKIVNPEVQKAINEHYGFNDEIMYGEEDDD